ncbi:MAG: osmotically inducible protein OsmC [Candidatus Wallbacteria bacterium HGW-Wallbacteria-1]|jgi:putative redox protein|uniref:Osmotically inducible protein OsmC n=1 Tax=Candidatus Wallbacteria bacterium HGW-Wallbacteria-1 TaxID=2013854 RepID=A0A2N1PQT7_9BACT|nr:MAG: osmotically inducible protein OsmC [Candidatus Wallbacteria bacterium HGW-Wallbacteria-1]
MVKVEITYDGELRCRACHEPSSAEIVTDAPLDNHGKGEAFSPTDLVGTALGTCIATILGITAQSRNWNLKGMKITVNKEMATEGTRRIKSLETHIWMPISLSGSDRIIAEKVPHSCPVKLSLHPEVNVPVIFHWPEQVRSNHEKQK